MNCIYCQGGSVVKRGMRKNDSGNKQRYICKDCTKSFVEHDGFERMRNKKENIVRAIHQYEDGFSMNKVQNHLWQHDGVAVTQKTLYEWVRKYSTFLKSDKFKRAANIKGKTAHGRKIRKGKRERMLRPKL